MVRWPTRASSRTPLSAISEAFDLGRGGLDLRLGGFELAPGLRQRLLRLVARGIEVGPPLASVSLAWRMVAYSVPPW